MSLFAEPTQYVPGVQTQGREANHSGQFLEEAIEREFGRRGIASETWKQSARGNGHLFAHRRLTKRVPYASLYGGRASYSEFVYFVGLSPFLRIECRWQEKPGSVDEKFPYLFLNARDHMPEPNIWLVIDGDGARPKGIAWLKREAATVSRKLIRVLTLTEAKKAVKRLVETGAA